VRVFDADVHLAETPADLVPHAEPPWRRVLAEPIANPPWTTDGTVYPRFSPRPTPAEPARGPAELAARLSERGVDGALALPGPLLKLGLVHTADYAAALAQAYNRWLVERWLEGPADGPPIYGAVLAAPHDPVAAAREVERHAAHRRVVAVVAPSAGVATLWGDRRYDPIYAAAEAAGRPVLLHGVERLMAPSTTNQSSYYASEFDQEVMGHSLIAMANLTHLVGTGVLARFPKLRVVFLGSGISWLPHMMLRLDKEYSENRRDVPFYRDRISLTVRERVWVGTHPIEGTGDPRDLHDLVRVSCGIERVVYGSHWPHGNADSPERVAGAFPDEESRRRVLGGNADELFGVGVGAG
jgi:uncharacterized protein